MNDNNKDRRVMYEINCPACGTVNSSVFNFCEQCGMRLPKGCEISHIEGSLQSENFTAAEDCDNTDAKQNEEGAREKNPEKRKKCGRLWYIAAMILIIITGYLIYENVIEDAGLAQLEEISQEREEPQESENAKGDIETPAALHEMDDGDMTVISWDWDWDSARKKGKVYTVDGILYVRNDGLEPAVGMDYSVDGRSVKCWGFVAAGEKGIMLCTIDTEKKNYVPEKASAQLEAIYTNDNLTAYTVPSGRITGNYGEDNNSYDVTISNKNDTPLSSDAKLVLLLIKGDEIKESDATGKLRQEVAPKMSSYKQENAFYDPHLHHYKGENKKAFKVFAIDISALSWE